MQQLLDWMAELTSGCNKQVRIALATLLLNCSVALASGAVADVTGDVRVRVLSIVTEVCYCFVCGKRANITRVKNEVLILGYVLFVLVTKVSK